MKLEQKLILLFNDKDFREHIKQIRKSLGMPLIGFNSQKYFNDWNKDYSRKALLNLINQPGTKIDVKSFEKYKPHKIQIVKVSPKAISEQARILMKIYHLSDETLATITSLIKFNNLVITDTDNYKAFLTFQNNKWELFIKISGSCRADSIRWTRDIVPLQKFLSDYTSKSRPLKNLQEYRDIQQKKDKKWRALAYDKADNKIYDLPLDKMHKTIDKKVRLYKVKKNRLKKYLHSVE